MFANLAWNETVGLGYAIEGYRSRWETIEADNPELWNELKSNDVDAMIDELVRFKKDHYPATIAGFSRAASRTAKFVSSGWPPPLLGSIPNGRCGSTVW